MEIGADKRKRIDLIRKRVEQMKANTFKKGGYVNGPQIDIKLIDENNVYHKIKQLFTDVNYLLKSKIQPTIILNSKPMKKEKFQKAQQLHEDISKVDSALHQIERIEKPSFRSCSSSYENRPSQEVNEEIEKVFESCKNLMLKKIKALRTKLEKEFDEL